MKTNFYLIFIILPFMIMNASTLVTAQSIIINGSYTKDSIIEPFSGIGKIYSLKLNGQVMLNSDSSLVRVIMIDGYGNDFLVYEAYPLITAMDTFNVSNVCDETCYLDGYLPGALRIDIIDALIRIDNISIEINLIENTAEMQSLAKAAVESSKIETMNKEITRYGLYWRAGMTSVSSYSFQVKEQLFGNKFDLMGFDYYKGGVFERINKRIKSTSSIYVDSFDWRKRHGADRFDSPYFDGDFEHRTGWITPVRNQGTCGTCSIFSTVGAVEGRLNLYYNIHDKNDPHHADVDISEQDIWQCPYLLFPCSIGAFASSSYNRLKSYRCQENDYQYNINSTYCTKPSSCDGEIKIQDASSHLNIINEDYFRIRLFDYGPLTVTIPFLPSPYGGTVNHAVAVVGYETIRDGMTVYKTKSIDDSDIIIDKDSPLIGSSIYWFKNSWDYNSTPGGFQTWGEDGFGCIGFDNFDRFDYAYGKVFWEGKQEDPNVSGTSIQCSDEDGDGYYWWGISQTYPCSSCPIGIDPYEDCDDSDRDLGPYDAMYACSSNCESFDQTYLVNPNTTVELNEDFHQKKHVEIQQGATLVVNKTLFMAPGRKITVRKGGKLIITGQGKITSACNQLWHGIEVEGTNFSQITVNQGTCEIQEGGTVENAICGIKSILAPNQTESGAMIVINGAKFYNNRTGIYLTKYSGSVVFPYNTFSNCIFETKGQLLDGSTPSEFIRLENRASTAGVIIQGCSLNETDFLRKITGIRTYNSFFTCRINGITSTSFNNLYYGIHSISSQPLSSSVDIKQCNFINNYRSIYLSGCLAPRVTLNTIKVPNIDSQWIPIEGFTAYGLYLDASIGYKIEENIIFCDSYGDQPPVYINTCGIYIRNSGPDANEIYHNNITNIHCGIAAFGINRNGQGEGLNIKCNSFTNCGSDIGVYRGTLPLTANLGIKYHQGENNTSDPSKSAGNVFSSIGFQYHTYDINNATCMSIRYNHHRTQTIPPNLRMIPLAALSPGVTINQNTQSYYSSAASCPPSLGDNHSGSGWVQQADSLIEKAGSLETILLQQVDGGNTAGTAQDLLSSSPDEKFAVYTNLLSKSPYLSDTVMKTAVLREDLLNELMMRDILVANPQSAKSDTVLKALDNRFAPLNDTLMGDIMANEYIYGDKEILEMQRAETRQQYGITLNNRIHTILTDTSITSASDSITVIYALSERLPDRYALALLYVQSGNLASAGVLMNSITQTDYSNNYGVTEHNGYVDWIGIVDRALTNEAELAFDSLQVNSLFGILAADTLCKYYPAVYARNCLVHSGLITYQEPLVFDQELKAAKVRKHYPKFTIAHEGQGYLKIFPNPAIDYMIIEYQLNKGCSDGSIQVYSIDGKNIFQIPVNSINSEVILPVGNCSGSLIISLHGCSGLIENQKIVINR